MRRSLLLLALVSFLGSVLGSTRAEGAVLRRLELLGVATVPHALLVDGMVVGGLSALAWDGKREVFYALSDDSGQRAASRFYTLRVDLSSGRLASDGVVVEHAIALRDDDGEPFAVRALDPEGLALTPDRTLFLSSEGHIETGVPPRLAEFALDGSLRRNLDLEDRYLPRPPRLWRRQPTGARHNLGLESLTLARSGEWLFTATENALTQDGPVTDIERGSLVRIARRRVTDGRAVAEYAYLTEPIADAPEPADGFATAGLVELLALDDQRLLALERSYSAGAGNTIRLFEVDLSAARDVSGARALAWRDDLVPSVKRLVLDFAELGFEIDNVEGLSFGPTLADGRGTLVLISDDNFDPRQTTQVIAFAFDREPVTTADVQGAAHFSPLVNQWVFGVPGVVTAVERRDEEGIAWIQDPRTRDAVSTGLRVTSTRLPALEAGDRVTVDGRVAERRRPGQLPVTELVGGRFASVGNRGSLPEPVRLGATGRVIPAGTIDDDGLERFEPDADAIDFFESLEGMRVEIPDPLVVGPGSRFGDCVVLADSGEKSEPRTRRGGVRLAPFDVNPERIVVSTNLVDEACRANVGDRFASSIVGILHYAFGVYRVLVDQPLPARTQAPASKAPAPLDEKPGTLTVATFNVENLDPGDDKMGAVGRVIARDLGAPAVVALQEVQDDSGPEDDGTTSAERTLSALSEAVVAAGGPRYDFHQVDPENAADGGQPGGNIRVVFLVDPRRVEVVRRGEPSTRSSVEVRGDEEGPFLFPNPGRVAADDPAFATDSAIGYRATRKPLALEVSVAGRRIFFFNAHLKSKGGDDRLFGDRQPPRFVTEEQRSAQAARLREPTDEILAADPDAAVVVLGDLNDHEFRGPLAVLTSGSLVNLIDQVAEEDRYTYNYRGNSQVLDHVLVSPALEAGAEIRILPLHADFSVPRASDHDPILVRLEIPPPAD